MKKNIPRFSVLIAILSFPDIIPLSKQTDVENGTP